jgi:hypothetical protein
VLVATACELSYRTATQIGSDGGAIDGLLCMHAEQDFAALRQTTNE